MNYFEPVSVKTAFPLTLGGMLIYEQTAFTCLY